jgi:hypothetical protein
VELQPKTYLLIYAAIVTPIVVSFFFLRKRQGPSKLNLTGSEANQQIRGSGALKSNATTINAAVIDAAVIDAAPSPVEKSLNVFFQWNGHAWDAYETFGLPGGSSLEAVTDAYQKCLSSGDVQSMPYYQAAYDAVKRHYSS